MSGPKSSWSRVRHFRIAARASSSFTFKHFLRLDPLSHESSSTLHCMLIVKYPVYFWKLVCILWNFLNIYLQNINTFIQFLKLNYHYTFMVGISSFFPFFNWTQILFGEFNFILSSREVFHVLDKKSLKLLRSYFH